MSETITELARKLDGIYGTELTETLVEVATAVEQRLQELETCDYCEDRAINRTCRKHVTSHR